MLIFEWKNVANLADKPPKTILTCTNNSTGDAVVAYKVGRPYGTRPADAVHSARIPPACCPTTPALIQVKTTAPKRYVVRPPQGVILPGMSAKITLTMVGKDAESLLSKYVAHRLLPRAGPSAARRGGGGGFTLTTGSHPLAREQCGTILLLSASHLCPALCPRPNPCPAVPSPQVDPRPPTRREGDQRT